MRPYDPNTAPYMNIPRKPPRATLAALQWAADRAGLSYGRFMLGLTVRDELRIQEEYEEWRGQTIPLQKRLVDSEAVGSDAGSADNEAAVGNEEGAAGSVSGEQLRVNVDDGVTESGSGTDSLAAQTTSPSDLFDIHTLRTLLDRLPDDEDEAYYSLILAQGIPIATLLHEVEIWRGRRALFHKRTSPQKRFMAWLRKKYPEYGNVKFCAV